MTFTCVETRKFRLGINPADLTTAQEQGVRLIRSGGKMIPMFYKKARALQNEKFLDIALRPFRPKEPIRNDGDTAVELRIVYYFPHTSGTPKWKRDQVTFMTQRPDADNLSKAVVDCMTKAGFWDDDSMVNFNFAKYRSPNPCIRVEIREWKQTRNKTEEQLFSNS